MYFKIAGDHRISLAFCCKGYEISCKFFFKSDVLKTLWFMIRILFELIYYLNVFNSDSFFMFKMFTMFVCCLYIVIKSGKYFDFFSLFRSINFIRNADKIHSEKHQRFHKRFSNHCLFYSRDYWAQRRFQISI